MTGAMVKREALLTDQLRLPDVQGGHGVIRSTSR